MSALIAGQQIHSLRTSDLRSFLDAMAGGGRVDSFHTEAEVNSLLLRKGDKVV
ncbi:MAG: hypothetical protein JNM63_06920 [Spirochaetia bacterium]|nr:hypothetical protein [Spirochaetia bacterium]